jgi:hypothetical protein
MLRGRMDGLPGVLHTGRIQTENKDDQILQKLRHSRRSSGRDL